MGDNQQIMIVPAGRPLNFADFMDRHSYVCKVNKKNPFYFYFCILEIKMEGDKKRTNTDTFYDAVILETALIFYFLQVWTKYLEMRL